MTGVETTNGVVETNTVVVAAGAYGNALINPLGIDYGLRPNRVQVAIFRRPLDVVREFYSWNKNC